MGIRICAAWACLSLMLALPACGTVDAPIPAASPDAHLPAFRDCAEFEAHLRERAGSRIDENGLDLTDNHRSVELVASDRDGSLERGGSGDRVDSDIVRSAAIGTHVVTTWGPDDGLRVIDTAGPEPRLRATLTLPNVGEGGVFGFVAMGERLLVVGGADPKVFFPGERRRLPGQPAPVPDHTVELTLVDLSDPATPTIVATQTIGGRPVTATRTADVLRVVIATDAENQLPFQSDPDAARASVAAATASTWLPQHEIRDAAGTVVESGALVECASVRRPVDDSGLDLTTVLTIDPSRDDALSAQKPVAVLGSGEQVAAGETRLFTATSPGWNRSGAASDAPTAWVHAWDIAGSDPPVLLGSAPLGGHLPDPRAMSVRGDELRVALTTVAPWAPAPRAKHAVSVVLVRAAGGLVEPVPVPAALGNGRELSVLRWYDDAVLLASDALQQARSFPNQNAAALHLVRFTQDADTPSLVEIPQRTADFLPIGDGRLLGVGQRTQADETRGRLDLEVFLQDPGSDRRAGQQAISFGQGEEQGRFRWLPDRRVLLIPGWSSVGSDCAAGTECATAPRPACVGPCSIDASEEFNGLMGVRLTDDGRLRRAVWLASDLNPVEVVPVGDRIAVVGTSGLFIIDAELNPAGSVEYPQTRRVTRKG